jgi:arylsulfatase A-like enzyme
MVSMTQKSSRKRTVRKAPPHARVRTHMTKLLMCSVFSAAVAAITPVTTSAEAETIATSPKGMGYATGQLGKKHLVTRNDGNNYYGYRETPPPGYYGNWGFAPGGNYWDRNYLWRRSLGFWDTNSPACPFRSC